MKLEVGKTYQNKHGLHVLITKMDNGLYYDEAGASYYWDGEARDAQQARLIQEVFPMKGSLRLEAGKAYYNELGKARRVTKDGNRFYDETMHAYYPNGTAFDPAVASLVRPVVGEERYDPNRQVDSVAAEWLHQDIFRALLDGKPVQVKSAGEWVAVTGGFEGVRYVSNYPNYEYRREPAALTWYVPLTSDGHLGSAVPLEPEKPCLRLKIELDPLNVVEATLLLPPGVV